MSGKITKEEKQPDLSFESSDEANSSDRVCVGDLQELDESFEGFDEKSLKQLLEEREKLLSMLNNNSDDKQADDDEVETEEKSDGESVESSPTTSITTNSSVVVKQQEKLSEDISGEIAVPNNQNKRRHSADCLPIDNSVADLIEGCKTPIDAESSDEFRTPKKFRAIEQDDDEQQQQRHLDDAADNSFYFKTPGFDDSTPDDTAENFLLVDDVVVSEKQHRQESTPTVINTFDDLWDFSTVATGSGSDGVDIYDFDREFSNWTRDGCRKAGEFLTRYCRLAPDGPGIEPVYKRAHSLKGGQKCTVYIDRIQYRASGWKSSEEAARDEAALLTLRDILPASCQSVIDNVLKNDEAEPTNEISIPDDRNRRNVSLDRRYGKTVEEFEEYSEDGEYDEEFDEEIYKLLDEELENGLISSKNGVNRAAENNSRFEGLRAPPNVKDKYVLKYRGTEYFEVLPDGWIEVTHSSGVSVYLHKASRVCTLARPYFLGPGSVRNHNVPLACVPCYHQRKIKELHQQAAEKEKLESEKSAGNSNDPLASLDKLKMPQVKLQTVDDFKNRNLTSKQLNDYCQNLFDFEKIQVIRFKSWADHRIFHRKVKREQQQQHEQKLQTTATLSAGGAKRGGGRNGLLRNSASGGVCPISGDGAVNVERLGRPSLPSSVKLITVPDLEKGTKPQQKQFYLNPQGKTSISVLHEYVQKVLKGQVLYDYSETRNAANPYMATVKISSGDAQGSIGGASTSGANAAVDWVAAGNGVGNSKKNAKSDAARDALRILVPGIEFNEEGVAGGSGVNQDDVTDLFDLIAITDSRVHELSVKAGQPTPFVILQECLKRHAAFGDTTIGMEIRRVRHQKHEFQMQVGKHKVVVSCANKKEGKQKAAQFMLQKLQPQIKTWGSLIRLYGYGAQRKLQETRKEKDSIIKLQGQSKSQPTEPNTAILDKLRQEMKKLFDESSKATSSSVAAKSISNNPSNSIKSIDI